MHTKVSCLYQLPPSRSNFNAKVNLKYNLTLNKVNVNSEGYNSVEVIKAYKPTVNVGNISKN